MPGSAFLCLNCGTMKTPVSSLLFSSPRQLPPEECQALLPEASSAQGARDEPVAQRPGVPGVSGRGGASAAHGHLQPSAAAQEQDEEQSQRFRLQGAAAHVNAL